jgi:hypothetical protein
VKNQYFGDRNDLFKYELLLDLAASLPQPRLTLVPMLTPNDGSREGNVTGYVCGERRRILFNALRAAVGSGERDIRRLRDVLPNCGVQFFPYRDAEYFDERTREDYFHSIPTDSIACAVVFFDPDIGLQTGTGGYMRRTGVDKYLMYSELVSVAARATDDGVLVVYQHLQKEATKRGGDVGGRLRDLTSHLDTPYVWAVQWADLAFLVAVRDDAVAARVADGLREHARKHSALLFDNSGQPVSACGAPLNDSVPSVSDYSGRTHMAHSPKVTSERRGGTALLDDIVSYLNAAEVRATYGAVAQLVGGIAQSIGARLGGLAGRRREASWVVNAKTGMPTAYLPEHQHPALLKSRDIITTGDDLRRRLAEWKAAGAPRRLTIGDTPDTQHRHPRSDPPQAPSLSVDEQSDLRRKVAGLLNGFDPQKGNTPEGIRKRINRLSHDGGPIPREIAALMTTITEMRNSAEYESKVLSPSECAVVRHAWQAIQDWAQSVKRT